RLAGGEACSSPSPALQTRGTAGEAQRIEQKENKVYTVFTAVEYKTQVVAGTNYFIKVDVGQGEHLHLRVFQPLPHKNEAPSLTAYQTGKTANDPLNYF
uniref:Cystatin domain-containing protein n=1 Tax=Podarcis muralis TaxID=64176 RepID=A0A670JVN8_PODMU